MSQTIAPKKQKFVKIDNDVADVLRDRVEIDGTSLRITGPRLDPTLYKRVDKVLQQLGGKWKSGKTQAHVFESSPADAIESALGNGKVLNRKQSFQFFETPAVVADRLVELAAIESGMRMLEPSAGRGAIVRAINRKVRNPIIWSVELDESNIPFLRESNCTAVHEGDFLKTTLCSFGRWDAGFDRVLMNPPFTGGQDAEHVMHAFDLLKPGGRMVAIVGEGICTRTDRKAIDFQCFVQEHIVHEERLDNKAFKESGTLTDSRIIVLVKPD